MSGTDSLTEGEQNAESHAQDGGDHDLQSERRQQNPSAGTDTQEPATGQVLDSEEERAPLPDSDEERK